MVRQLFIVSRDYPDVYEVLREHRSVNSSAPVKYWWGGPMGPTKTGVRAWFTEVWRGFTAGDQEPAPNAGVCIQMREDFCMDAVRAGDRSEFESMRCDRVLSRFERIR
jgi:hypothetical protein